MISKKLDTKIENFIFAACYLIAAFIAFHLTEINVNKITLKTVRYFLDNFIFVTSIFLIPCLFGGLRMLHSAVSKNIDLNTMIRDIKLTIFFGYQVLISISWYFFFYK